MADDIRESDAAWLAGLFEGEGCIYHDVAMRNGRPRDLWYLSLVSTDEDVIRSAFALGGGTMRGPRPPRAGQTKEVWGWHVTAQADVAAVLRSILPWLHSRRGDLARQALAGIAVRDTRAHQRRMAS